MDPCAILKHITHGLLHNLYSILASNQNLQLEINNLDCKDPIAITVSSMLTNLLDTSIYDSLDSYQEQFMLFESALDFVWEKLHTGHWYKVEYSWRKLFTLISILKVRTVLYYIRDNEKKQ